VHFEDPSTRFFSSGSHASSIIQEEQEPTDLTVYLMCQQTDWKLFHFN